MIYRELEELPPEYASLPPVLEDMENTFSSMQHIFQFCRLLHSYGGR